MNKVKINDKFEISIDKHNWTLGEIRVTDNMTYVVNTYHANPKQVADKIVKLCDTTDVSSLYELMIEYQKCSNDICKAVDKLAVNMSRPLGEDSKPKDRVKLGLSPSTIIEEIDFRGIKQ